MTSFGKQDSLLLKHDDLVWREADDELIVLELSTSAYLTVSPSAVPLWHRLAEGTTVAELVEVLVRHYGIEPDQAEEDVDAFLQALEARSLLEPSGKKPIDLEPSRTQPKGEPLDFEPSRTKPMAP